MHAANIDTATPKTIATDPGHGRSSLQWGSCMVEPSSGPCADVDSEWRKCLP